MLDAITSVLTSVLTIAVVFVLLVIWIVKIALKQRLREHFIDWCIKAYRHPNNLQYVTVNDALINYNPVPTNPYCDFYKELKHLKRSFTKEELKMSVKDFIEYEKENYWFMLKLEKFSFKI